MQIRLEGIKCLALSTDAMVAIIVIPEKMNIPARQCKAPFAMQQVVRCVASIKNVEGAMITVLNIAVIQNALHHAKRIEMEIILNQRARRNTVNMLEHM